MVYVCWETFLACANRTCLASQQRFGPFIIRSRSQMQLEWVARISRRHGVIMRQLFFAVFLGAFFALVGYAAERAGIPPFNKMMEIMGANGVTITFAVVGLIVGFWLGNR